MGLLRERETCCLQSNESDFTFIMEQVLSKVNMRLVITLAKIQLGDPPVVCKCTPLPPGRSADPGAVLCSLSVFDGKWLR